MSDISVAEVARRHGLNANLVFNWRKKFGASRTLPRSEAPAPEGQLMPVEVKPDDPPQSTEFALRQGVDPDRDPSEHSGPADHAADGLLEIFLPCGSRVRCSSGIEAALLGKALTALRPVQAAGSQ